MTTGSSQFPQTPAEPVVPTPDEPITGAVPEHADPEPDSGVPGGGPVPEPDDVREAEEREGPDPA